MRLRAGRKKFACRGSRRAEREVGGEKEGKKKVEREKEEESLADYVVGMQER